MVWNGAANESMLLKLATTLQQHNDKCGPRPLIHSVWANFNAARVNTVFGHHFQHLHGSHWLWQVRAIPGLLLVLVFKIVEILSLVHAMSYRHVRCNNYLP